LTTAKSPFFGGFLLNNIAGFKKTAYLCALQVSCRVVSLRKEVVLMRVIWGRDKTDKFTIYIINSFLKTL